MPIHLRKLLFQLLDSAKVVEVGNAQLFGKGSLLLMQQFQRAPVGGFLLLLSAVVLPYTPDELPKIADLHVICAFTASCLLVLSLFLLLLQKARQDRQRYWDCMKWLGVTVLLSLVLFAMVGIISSALEIFFVLSTTLLARRLWYLERGGGKN